MPLECIIWELLIIIIILTNNWYHICNYENGCYMLSYIKEYIIDFKFIGVLGEAINEWMIEVI